MRNPMLVVCVVVGLASAGAALAQDKAKSGTEEEKTAYAIGYQFAKSRWMLNLSPSERESLKRGVADASSGAEAAVDLETYGAKVQTMARSRQAWANMAFLSKAAKEKGAKTLPTGVVYRELKAGTGASPKASDTVSVHYRGTLPSGEEFDSSFKRGQPAQFPLTGVIPCWTEGVQQLKVGGKAKLVCPAAQAYGESPPRGSQIPPNSVLQFEVELLGIGGAN